MKKSLILIILSICNLVAIAASPKLSSEKIFEDIDLYDPSLSVTIIERPGQTIRTLSFKNKPDMQKKIQKALDSDKEKAISKSLVSDNGEISESIVIINDEEEINIGFTNSKSKEVYFFVQKKHKNNVNTVKSSSKSTKTTKTSNTTKKKTINIQKRNKSDKSLKSVSELNSEHIIGNETLIISGGTLIKIETDDSDFLTEI